MRNFRELDFWTDSKTLAIDITKLTCSFPNIEKYALSDQLRRAVVSIAANIAEGCGRNSNADFSHFLHIAMGSAFETESHIEIAYGLGYLSESHYQNFIERLASIQRRINGYINYIKSLTPPK